jgi:flavin-binding protein dodecin
MTVDALKPIGVGNTSLPRAPSGAWPRRYQAMSVYKVVEIIGTSSESWEDAGLTAIKKARETIRHMRVAEVVEQDLDLDDAGGATFRTKLRISFKYDDG